LGGQAGVAGMGAAYCLFRTSATGGKGTLARTSDGFLFTFNIPDEAKSLTDVAAL
jgi:hypothetical protein